MTDTFKRLFLLNQYKLFLNFRIFLLIQSCHKSNPDLVIEEISITSAFGLVEAMFDFNSLISKFKWGNKSTLVIKITYFLNFRIFLLIHFCHKSNPDLVIEEISITSALGLVDDIFDFNSLISKFK